MVVSGDEVVMWHCGGSLAVVPTYSMRGLISSMSEVQVGVTKGGSESEGEEEGQNERKAKGDVWDGES
jgi:hypothetical protein